MFTIVSYQPEILLNAGNITRLYANTGANLRLVKSFGFPLDSSKTKCASLDYREFAKLTVHENFEDCLKTLEGRRIFALTTKGSIRSDEVSFRGGDVLLFGPGTRNLPVEILDSPPAGQKIRLPMMPGSRSMDLSNTVAVILFEV